MNEEKPRLDAENEMEYYAAMIDAKAIKNHKLADEMHKLYNEYNNLI